MKRLMMFVAFASILMVGCKKDNSFISSEGLSMKIGDQEVLTMEDVDYYDLSSHIFYLKNPRTFVGNNNEAFHFYVGNEKIYSGILRSSYSSMMPSGPYISSPDIFYGNNVLPIYYSSHYDLDGKRVPAIDPRNDPRILMALKSNGKLREGLACKIKSVRFVNGLKLDLELSNYDSFNYYFLDPEKMGQELFNYFTNGPVFFDLVQYKMFETKTTFVQPVPYDYVDMRWLSLIRSGEKRNITVSYPKFEPLLPGYYQMSFSFPGLSIVNRSETIKNDGRIWLGRLELSREIRID